LYQLKEYIKQFYSNKTIENNDDIIDDVITNASFLLIWRSTNKRLLNQNVPHLRARFLSQYVAQMISIVLLIILHYEHLHTFPALESIFEPFFRSTDFTLVESAFDSILVLYMFFNGHFNATCMRVIRTIPTKKS
jgi:hypothetical protein